MQSWALKPEVTQIVYCNGGHFLLATTVDAGLVHLNEDFSSANVHTFLTRQLRSPAFVVYDEHQGSIVVADGDGYVTVWTGLRMRDLQTTLQSKMDVTSGAFGVRPASFPEPSAAWGMRWEA